jgi:hypothetical protein
MLSLNPTQKNIRIASDSKNYLKARFIFQTSEWAHGIVHYALFSHDGETYKKFLGAEPGCKSNECFVPPEVIKTGHFNVSIFCDDLITSTVVAIPVEESGYTENIIDPDAELKELKSRFEELEAFLFSDELVIYHPEENGEGDTAE